jgi:hypothetical protein
MTTTEAMDVAAAQHGLLTREQAVAMGVRRQQLEYRLGDRTLVPVHEGVYRFAAAPVTHEQSLLAACFGAGHLSAVSHRAAADVHGIWSTRDLVEVTVTRERAPELHGVTVHRIADLSERWIVHVDAVPVTTPARTLVDLGAVLPLGSVGPALDRALGRKLVSLAEVRAALDAVARKGRAGAGVIRRLLDERQRGSSGVGVLALRLQSVMRRYGIPDPVPEYTVLDEHGGFVGRVDFAYPELQYAIEADGYEAHSTPRAFQHDRARQNDLVDLGWTVHRFTWTDVDRRAGLVANRILHVLGRLNLTMSG